MSKNTFLITLLVWTGMWAGLTCAHEAGGPTSIKDLPLEQVSENIYVVHGSQEMPNPRSRGFMNNPGAIVGEQGVIIVDPGSSREIGEQLLEKLRAVTSKPVIAIFNTHVHGDHWLGNHGIRLSYPNVPIYAHSRMIERVQAGVGGEWLDVFMVMTQGAVNGTEVIGPSIGLDGGEELLIGDIHLRIHYAGHAHTDNDIMIEVVEGKSLFVGDVVAANRVQSAVPQDANIKGQIKAVKGMLDQDFQLFIPGHGHSGGREVPQASLRYFETLYASVVKYFEQGLDADEMKGMVMKDMDEYHDWHNFEQLGRVIDHIFLEVEEERF